MIGHVDCWILLVRQATRTLISRSHVVISLNSEAGAEKLDTKLFWAEKTLVTGSLKTGMPKTMEI